MLKPEEIDLANLIVGTVASTASVIAIFMAGASLSSAKREGTRARELVVRERRIDFELSVIKEIVDIWAIKRADMAIRVPHEIPKTDDLDVRLMMLPSSDFKWLRLVWDVDGIDGDRPPADLSNVTLPEDRFERASAEIDLVRHEGLEAIAKRLAERESR